MKKTWVLLAAVAVLAVVVLMARPAREGARGMQNNRNNNNAGKKGKKEETWDDAFKRTSTKYCKSQGKGYDHSTAQCVDNNNTNGTNNSSAKAKKNVGKNNNKPSPESCAGKRGKDGNPKFYDYARGKCMSQTNETSTNKKYKNQKNCKGTVDERGRCIPWGKNNDVNEKLLVETNLKNAKLAKRCADRGRVLNAAKGTCVSEKTCKGKVENGYCVTGAFMDALNNPPQCPGGKELKWNSEKKFYFCETPRQTFADVLDNVRKEAQKRENEQTLAGYQQDETKKNTCPGGYTKRDIPGKPDGDFYCDKN